MEKKYQIIIAVAVLIILAVGFYLLTGWMSRTTGYAISEGSNAAMAKCLSDKEVILYCANANAACDSQKEVFGSDFKLLNYVECVEEDLCGGLREVPAWQVNGEIYYGTKSVQELRELSNC